MYNHPVYTRDKKKTVKNMIIYKGDEDCGNEHCQKEMKRVRE